MSRGVASGSHPDGVGAWACRVRGLGTDEVVETAELGESPEGDKEAIVVPVLCVSCNSQDDVLLLCGLTLAHE